MRPLCLLFLSAAAALSQPFSFGVKGGLPMTDFIDAVGAPPVFLASTTTNRYIVGPTAELRLPFGFGVEVDALYRHFSYASTISLIANFEAANTTTGAWEFPLLAKYRFKGKLIRPYVAAGVSWDRLSGLTTTVKSIVNNITTTSTTSSPAALNKDTTIGYVLGAGVDIKALLIHVSPEVRFTRWGAKHFIESGSLSSTQNQAEFLVGITF
jgi:opacity protein-like surface antigen